MIKRVIRAVLLLGLVSGAPVLAAALTLPLPSGAPQSIDFDRDPLIVFGHSSAPVQPFLETLGRAVETHPAVLAAISATAAATGVRTQVRSGLFPQVDSQLTATRLVASDFSDRTAVVESLQQHTRTDANVSANQLLYDFGATGSRIAAANARIGAAKADVERTASDTAMRAISAWYDVLIFQTLDELGTAAVARRQEILSNVRTRIARGIGASGDAARAEAVLAETQAQGARYARLLGQARGRYVEAFGSPPPPQLSRIAPPQSQARSIDAAQALAHSAPAVQAALRRVEAARRDWGAVKSDGLPRLSVGLNNTRYDVFSGSDYEVRGTFTLRQSLFAGGRQRGAVSEARARFREAGHLADQVNNETERDAGIALTDVAALTTSAASLQTAYVANRVSRDTYVEQFRVSRGTLIELLRAEQDYFSAAANYLQGVVELDVARFTLLVRTGEILKVAGISLSATDS